MRQRLLIWLAVIAGIELLSVATIFDPPSNGIACLAVGVAVFVVTLWKPSYGLGAVAVELIVGSKGALLKFGGDAVNDGGIPLRVILFVSVLVAWLIRVWIDRAWKSWDRDLWRTRWLYLLLGIVAVSGFVVGWLNRNPFLIADANAWGFWLLLLPAIDLVTRRTEETERVMVPAVVAALLWMTSETFVFFYLFTHGFVAVGDPSYLWLRRTGVGEVTKLMPFAPAYRVFFQSQIMAALAAVILIVRQWTSRRLSQGAWHLLLYALLAVVISLSRSFWIGMAVALFGVLVVLVRSQGRRVLPGLTVTLFAACASLVLVEALLVVPLPTEGTIHVTQLLGLRAESGEAAALSRWQLLPALWEKIQEAPLGGSGFGSTVTFTSSDPRIVAATGGRTTAYAFEWGWLDLWIKLGVLGPLLLLAILASLFVRLWRTSLPEWLRLGAVSGVAALGMIHIFTPYLNHPLGIGALIAAEALVAISGKRSRLA